MKLQFVSTENDRRFKAALAQKQQRAARESVYLVVTGRAGVGKTRTLHNWASSCNAVMVEAYPGWTPRRAMADVASKLGIPITGSWEQAVEARIAEEEIPLIVDEAGHALTNRAECLERLRRITDKSSTLLVMVVMEPDFARLLQYQQITSRATLCPFAPNALADVKAVCAQLSEVAIADDLAERIHRESKALMRLVLEGINIAERVGQSQGKTAVCAEDLKGWALCEDFGTMLSSRVETLGRQPRGRAKGRGAA